MLRCQESNAEFRIDMLVSWRFLCEKKKTKEKECDRHYIFIIQFNLQDNVMELLLLSASLHNENTESREIMSFV